MFRRLSTALLLGLSACLFAACSANREDAENAVANAPAASDVAIDADDIGGTVSDESGAEAGVWVIAETHDLPTTFRKIVVTDDEGRFVIPDLPAANYEVWVRGYGLVDSEHVQASPGAHLALNAVQAPTPQAAARYFPANYWLSLLNIPKADEFPLTIPPAPADSGAERVGGSSQAVTEPTVLNNQAEWIHALKRGCEACHQLGNTPTRDFPATLGHFDNSEAAWERRLSSGQTGSGMLASLSALGYQRGLSMFADWTDRIEAGEVPATPPRPSGVERNVVISIWDYASDRAFVHDIISTDKLHPTENADGRIYGLDWSGGTLEILDPVSNEKSSIRVPLRDEGDRERLRTWSPQKALAPSPYWGNELVWDDPVNPNQPHMDQQGRVWFNTQTRLDQPQFCKSGSDNPFAQNYPLDNPAKGVAVYDPATGQFQLIDMCFSGQHGIFADDDDATMYFSMNVGLGWLKTKVWEETHNAEAAQGWCPAVVDYNGDGHIGEFTRADEPADPNLDREIAGANGYGVAYNPADGSAWYVGGVIGPDRNAAPGRIFRVVPGENPPDTCMVEVYEPPFQNPNADEEGYFMQGIDVDSNGIVWTALAGSNHLASFDRSKCTVLNGPTATGQQCPEGWTLYPVPGPTFKGTDVRTDYYYYNWVDRFNVLGLGDNTPVINGTGSDALIAFEPDSKQFVTLRVPYPLGFYTRGMDGRIDDPDAGWKGRGLWAADNTRVAWHIEGGRGQTSVVAKFQIRPDPLAK